MSTDRLDEITFWLLGALVAFVPLGVTSMTSDIFATPKITLLRSAAAVLLTIAALRLAITKRIRLPKGPLMILAGLLLLLTAGAAGLSIAPAISIIGLRKRFFGLTTYIVMFVVFASAASLDWNYKRLRIISWMVGAAGGVTALLGLAQALGVTWPADLTATFGGGVYSTLGNPNFLGAYLAIALAPTLALVFSEPTARGRSAGAAALITIVLGLIATRSSGALAAMVITTVVFVVAIYAGAGNAGQKRAVIIVGVALCLFSGLWLLKSDPQALRGRAAIWRGTLRLIADHPWHGVGPDATRYAIPVTMKPVKNMTAEIPEDAHNIFLTIAATAGLPALFVFIGLIGAALWGAAVEAGEAGERVAVLLRGFLAAIIAYLIVNLANPDNLVSSTLFWLSLGIISGRRWGKSERESRVAAYSLAGIFVVGAMITVTHSVRAARAEIAAARGEAASSIDDMAAEFTTAAGFNPYYDWYPIRITDRLTPLVTPASPRVTGLALAAANSAIHKAPPESDNYVIKGSVYRALVKAGGNRRDLHKAIRLYKRALELNRFNLNAIRDLIDSYMMLGDEDQARFWIDRYLRLQDDPEIAALRSRL